LERNDFIKKQIYFEFDSNIVRKTVKNILAPSKITDISLILFHAKTVLINKIKKHHAGSVKAR
jgi:hypothetical protein